MTLFICITEAMHIEFLKVGQGLLIKQQVLEVFK
jgi:hypothetical protein